MMDNKSTQIILDYPQYYSFVTTQQALSLGFPNFSEYPLTMILVDNHVEPLRNNCSYWSDVPLRETLVL